MSPAYSVTYLPGSTLGLPNARVLSYLKLDHYLIYIVYLVCVVKRQR